MDGWMDGSLRWPTSRTHSYGQLKLENMKKWLTNSETLFFALCIGEPLGDHWISSGRGCHQQVRDHQDSLHGPWYVRRLQRVESH